MIRVTVELINANTGAITKLGEMHIANDGKTTAQDASLGSYEGRILRKPHFKSVTRTGTVINYNRVNNPVWVLIGRMLKNMGYV